MIVWLNTDGSVGEIVSSYVLTDSDGNEYTAFSPREGGVSAGGIFVYFEGGNPSGGLSYSTWELPDGSTLSVKYKASWGKECTIAFDKSRDMRKFKAEQAYEMQYFQFPADLISKGGSGIYKVGVSDSTTVDSEPVSYPYGPILFSVAENAVIRETTITKTEYDLLTAELESKADKSTLQADYQLQYSSTNVRGYPQYESARGDLAKLATDQYVIYQTGSDAATLCEVSSSKGLTPLALDNAASRKYYVYTSKAASTAGVVQSVGTGLCVYYTDADGNKVNYGTNPLEFYAYVLDGNSNYDGTISLGAKNYKFAYDTAVDVFFSDGNTTKIVSPMGNASVELTNADVKAYGTNVYIGSRGDESGSANSGKIKIGNSVLITGGGAVIKLSPADSVTFGGGRVKVDTLATFSVSPYCAKDPAGDEYLVNKAYVDTTASAQATEKANAEQSRAQEKETDLQSQINAINASQNFVATYAKKADMPTPPVSGLEEKDCVLVLKDEDHQDQAYVYKYNSAGWVEVGPLGDYYTKAYINAEFAKTNGNVAYYRSQADSYAKKVDDYANATDDKIAELGKVVDTAKDAYLASTPTFVETSSSTEESDVTPTLVGLFAETGSSTTISE